MNNLDNNNISEDEIYKRIKKYTEDIEVPESIRPDNIEKKLRDVKQEDVISTRSYKKPLAIAASFAVVAIAGALVAGIFLNSRDTPVENTTGTEVVEQTEEVSAELTYAEVCDIINSYNYSQSGMENEYGIAAMTEDAVADGTGSAGISSYQGAPVTNTASEYSRTDEQVEGVEEGDIIKTDGRYIYTIEETTFGSTLHIIDPNGNSSKEISSLIYDQVSVREMYVYQDSLVIISEQWSEETEDITGASGGLDVSIYITDISDATAPKNIKKLTQSGYFATSRISDGYLYTFTEKRYTRDDYTINYVEDFVPMINNTPISSDKIVKAGNTDANDYMIMTSLSLDNPVEFSDEIAALGGYATYYVSTEHIYIAKPEYTDYKFVTDELKTTITKFTYDDGDIVKNTSVTFRGRIDNSYYLHEYQGNLCFVYMRYSGKSTNGLCIVDENLKPLGELTNIAPDEEIYASYYIENMAYFVTYRNTDPVFAVDISNPEKPELKSKLKLPGYSSYMHAFGDGQLIGIGYGQTKGDEWDQTTKLSLFGIGDDYVLSEKSKVFLKKDSMNYASEDHRVVYVDEENSIVGFAVEYYDDNSDRTYMNYVVFKQQGKKLIKVLSKKIKITNNMEYTANYSNLRGVRIGDAFYICNCQGVIGAYKYNTGDKWSPVG